MAHIRFCVSINLLNSNYCLEPVRLVEVIWGDGGKMGTKIFSLLYFPFSAEPTVNFLLSVVTAALIGVMPMIPLDSVMFFTSYLSWQHLI